jgi:nucleoside-diphosphate-sugar epimerase
VDVLITGATGFIGTSLLRDVTRHHRVVAVARNPPVRPGDPVRWIAGDLADSRLGDRLPPHVDAIVYLAQSRRYRQFPAGAADVFDVNIAGLMSMLDYARLHGVGCFVLASSANVYRRADDAIREDAPIEPRTFYARSKVAAELLLQSYADVFRCVVLRLFTVYGPGQSDALIPSLLDRVRSRRPIQIEGDVGLKVSPIFVDDVAHAIVTLLESDPWTPRLDTFNVGGEEAATVLQLGQLIGDVLRISPQFDFVPGNPSGWVADISRLRMALGPRSFTGLREGFLKMAAVKALEPART